MPNEITYKSFCWSLGTTSFRTRSFNKAIEVQLSLLDEFWTMPENKEKHWEGSPEIQTAYYYFMQSKGFVEGTAKRTDKDAREKTSGLADMGLIYADRQLTPAGNALLNISRRGDFSTDNFLQIPKDSFIYLKQLLKMATADGKIRPFVILLHLLHRFEYLSLDEFTYLLPLCTDQDSAEQIGTRIERLRKGCDGTTIDSIIINRLMEMENYKAALEKLLANKVDEALICEIGMNRKRRQYDIKYFPLYRQLFDAYINRNDKAFSDVFKTTKSIAIGKYWRNYIFDAKAHIRPTAFDRAANEESFKAAFFKTMHLLKAKATLRDYSDLNRRYMRTADILLFADDQVRLDIVPKHFFGRVDDELYSIAYSPAPNLFDDCPLEEIAPRLAFDESTVVGDINAAYDTRATAIEDVRQILDDDRYKRFGKLIAKKFSDKNILRLLDYFERRNDVEIRKLVTNDADIPTIFEYVLGIAWYKISGQKGRILDYMKLSLDADLLPKTHAAGGDADIVYEYGKTSSYPAHALLIEATLADGTNQRRMEMEPVSRHLGQYILKTGDENAYCIFITPYLDLNVLSDFCSRRAAYFYETKDFGHWDEARLIKSMKIIPLRTEELKKLIKNRATYEQLYSWLTADYSHDMPPHIWYKENIVALADKQNSYKQGEQTMKLTEQGRDEARELLRAIIQTNTVNPPGNEKPLAEKLAALLKSEGIEAETVEVEENRANLIVKIAGENHGKLLMATGHLDTVPPGNAKWEHDPFAAEVIDGKLYGRGASDMKAGDAAFLYAMIILKRAGITPKQDIIFVGTVGEENESVGAKAFEKSGGMDNVDALIVCEPSSDGLYIAHKGAVWAKVKFSGKTAHGSMPDLGVNAVVHAAKFISALDGQKFTNTPDPILGMPTCSVNLCQGGVATNVVPDYCEVKVDFRTIPGQTSDEIRAYIESALKTAGEGEKDFKAEYEFMLELSAIACPEGTTLLDAIDKAAGKKHERCGVRFYTDASALVGTRPNLPVVIYGPGLSEMAHQPNEYVELEQYYRFIETYANLLTDYAI